MSSTLIGWWRGPSQLEHSPPNDAKFDVYHLKMLLLGVEPTGDNEWRREEPERALKIILYVFANKKDWGQMEFYWDLKASECFMGIIHGLMWVTNKDILLIQTQFTSVIPLGVTQVHSPVTHNDY